MPDKFVELAVKLVYVGLDSFARFLAHSHFLVARSLANTNEKAIHKGYSTRQSGDPMLGHL